MSVRSIAVVLMLAMILAYVFTNNLSLQPGKPAVELASTSPLKRVV